MTTINGPPSSVRRVIADRLADLNHYMTRLADALRSSIAEAVSRAVADSVKAIVENILSRLDSASQSEVRDSWDDAEEGGWDAERFSNEDDWDRSDGREPWDGEEEDRWQHRGYRAHQQSVVATPPSSPSFWPAVLAAGASAAAWLARHLLARPLPLGPMPTDEAIRSSVRAADPVNLSARIASSALPLVALVAGLRWIVGTLGLMAA
jgi:hypothetical protein